MLGAGCEDTLNPDAPPEAPNRGVWGVPEADEGDLPSETFDGEGWITGVQILNTVEPHPGEGSACIESTCLDGQVRLGGGAFWANVDVDQHGPLGEGFGVCGYSEQPSTWFAHAVCVDEKAELDVEDVTTEDALLAGDSGCVVTRCPDGKKVVSGGGFFAHTMDVDHIRPLDERTFAVCGTAAEDSAYAADAVCAFVPDADYAQVEVEAELVADENGCVHAVCPAGFAATGGGAAWDAQAGFRLDTLRPTAPDTFAVCGTGEEATAVTASVICVRAGS